MYIAGDGARFTIRHDGKPAIEVQFDDARPDLHHLARKWDDPEPVPLPMSAREPSSPRRQPRGDEARYNSPSGSVA